KLALVYSKQGKYDEAEALYKRALEIRERVSGKQSINAAITLRNLANLYKMQGKYEQAEPLYQQALAIFKEKYQMEDRRTARCLTHSVASSSFSTTMSCHLRGTTSLRGMMASSG